MDGEGLDSVLDHAVALAREGRDAERERLLRAALERFPQSFDVRLLLAATLLEDRPAEARDLVVQAVALAPDDPAILTRAGSLMTMLDIERAQEYAHRALAGVTPDFALAADLAHLVGRLAWAEGNEALAEEALRAAFDDDPAAIGHGRALAGCLAAQGRTTEAQDVVAVALEHRPGDERLLELRDRLAAEDA